jgi:hypothetical protein
MSVLIRPALTHQESYIEALVEYQAEGRYTQLDLAALRRDLSGHIAELLAQETLEEILVIEGLPKAKRRYWIEL